MYRLMNAGCDILALQGLKEWGLLAVASLWDKIGAGKESGVYLAVTPRRGQIILKFH